MLKLSISLETVLLGISSGIAIPAPWYDMYRQKKYHDTIQFQWIVLPLVEIDLFSNVRTSKVRHQGIRILMVNTIVEKKNKKTF